MAGQTPRTEGPVTASVERVRHELDRWLEAAFSQGGRALDAIGLRPGSKTLTPAADVVESPDEFLVLFDLPGVDPVSIDACMAGNVLTVKGEKPVIQTAEGDVVHHNERAHGAFSRSVTLPGSVNADAVSAEAHDGVLRVRLPKAEQTRVRHIRVSVETPVGAGTPRGGPPA